MEEHILTYLEHYGQPQTVAAIFEHGLASEGEYAVVEATLEGMVAAGQIKRVQVGVHSDGSPTLEYAPLSFAG